MTSSNQLLAISGAGDQHKSIIGKVVLVTSSNQLLAIGGAGDWRHWEREDDPGAPVHPRGVLQPQQTRQGHRL